MPSGTFIRYADERGVDDETSPPDALSLSFFFPNAEKHVVLFVKKKRVDGHSRHTVHIADSGVVF
jgi:hypothetical protein